MDIRKVKVTLLAPEGNGMLPHPVSTRITDEAGNQLVCAFPIDIHIDSKGCWVTLTMQAEVEIEGQIANLREAVIQIVKKAQMEKRL